MVLPLVASKPASNFWQGEFMRKGEQPHRLVCLRTEISAGEVDQEQTRKCSPSLATDMDLQGDRFMMRSPASSVDLWASVDSSEFATRQDNQTLSKVSESAVAFDRPTLCKLGTDEHAAIYGAIPDGPPLGLLEKINDRDPLAIYDMFVFHLQVQE